jgi:ornithine cyclodeaminase/alanine dehydrogenase-like protein (mu-crystallin family)
VGIGLQDVAITELVVKEAEAKGLGTIVENYD